MNPALSVIIFSVFSGFGFGLMFWLGLGLTGESVTENILLFLVALATASIGLVAATFHLGNPQRAWRAFTQWKSSWLSREGWAAVITLILMSIYGAVLIFKNDALVMVGILGALLALTTVFTTAMIYTQLKTVPRWHHWSTPVMFLGYSIIGGSLFVVNNRLAILLLILMAVIQIAVWLKGDKQFDNSSSTIETATQLGSMGKVRMFESPHTGSNYLMKEMGFVIARKHAIKLRKISILLMCIIPIALLLVFSNGVLLTIAVIVHISGVMISRWLFFAQAEHVMGLYYDLHS